LGGWVSRLLADRWRWKQSDSPSRDCARIDDLEPSKSLPAEGDSDRLLVKGQHSEETVTVLEGNNTSHQVIERTSLLGSKSGSNPFCS
jgi:hypothetical protein